MKATIIAIAIVLATTPLLAAVSATPDMRTQIEMDAKLQAIKSATDMKEGPRPMQKRTPQPSNTNLPVAPPPGAIGLFDGKDLSQWSKLNGQPAHWKVENGYVEVATGGNIRTKQEFGDCRLHVEFWLPLMADKTGQDRANSGVYLLGRHEVQVLDTFGLPPADNGCGGIYKVAVPEVSASLPPEEWQSYDIFYTAPTVKDGQMVTPARISVIQNNVRIHNNVEIAKPSTGGGINDKWAEKGPLMLQDHGNKVRYRNIWIVPGTATGSLRLVPVR